MCKKAASKMLVKLTPVVNFINVLRAHFLYKILAPKNYKAKRFSFVIFGAKIWAKKALVKC